MAKFALQSAREEDHVIRETVSHADVLEKVLLFIIVDRGQKQKVEILVCKFFVKLISKLVTNKAAKLLVLVL